MTESKHTPDQRVAEFLRQFDLSPRTAGDRIYSVHTDVGSEISDLLVSDLSSLLEQRAELLEAAKIGADRAAAISNLIDQQIDEKIRGERRHYDWTSIISTIKAEADAIVEDASPTIKKAENQS